MSKEHPILFKAPMVRAILDGTKTQTRRIVKPRYIKQDDFGHDLVPAFPEVSCQYGQPGDRLWVRETFDPIYGQSPPDRVIEIDYKADWVPRKNRWRIKDELGTRRWTPSIHMPRWASRILLEIISVRVERLQDISEADAVAEGCQAVQGCEWRTFEEADAGIQMHKHTAIDAYSALWDAINGPGSWDANPWVWVVEFKRVQS